MKRRGRAAILVVLAAVILLAGGLYLKAVLSLAQPGGEREARQQVEELSEILRQFLGEHRDALEALAADAQAGNALPDNAVQALVDSAPEGLGVGGVLARDGLLYLTLNDNRHTGKLDTYATLGSGPPPLPDGLDAEAAQTFWTLDGGNGFYHYMELLEEGWYAEYECYTRG